MCHGLRLARTLSPVTTISDKNSKRRSLAMGDSSDSHEFSEGWPSSPLSASYDEDAESSVEEVKQEPGVTTPSWSRDLQHRSDQPRRQPRYLPTSLPRHSGNSHPGGPLSTRNPGFSRTLPPLDSSTIPPRSRNLLGQSLPDRLPSLRDLPSSHLHLPSFSVLDDLPPISPAASQSSNDSWLGSWPSLTQSEYVDLTNDPSPPIMPPTTRTKRRASRSLPSEGHSIAESSPKRRKTAGRAKGAERLKKEDSDPPEVDLTHVNDDNSLEKALENQQEKAIKAQREEQGDEPVKLAGLQCIICLETMVNITATHCGESATVTHRELIVTDSDSQKVIYSAIPVSWKLLSQASSRSKTTANPWLDALFVGRRLYGRKLARTTSKSYRSRSSSQPGASYLQINSQSPSPVRYHVRSYEIRTLTPAPGMEAFAYRASSADTPVYVAFTTREYEVA